MAESIVPAKSGILGLLDTHEDMLETLPTYASQMVHFQGPWNFKFHFLSKGTTYVPETISSHCVEVSH